MKDLLTKYQNLKSLEEKRLFCLKLDENKKHFNLLSFDKLSEFTINVCFKLLTGHDVNKVKEKRHVNYKEHNKY